MAVKTRRVRYHPKADRSKDSIILRATVGKEVTKILQCTSKQDRLLKSIGALDDIGGQADSLRKLRKQWVATRTGLERALRSRHRSRDFLIAAELLDAFKQDYKNAVKRLNKYGRATPLIKKLSRDLHNLEECIEGASPLRTFLQEHAER